MQINIPAHMVKTIKVKLDDKDALIDTDVFADATKEVIAMLARDKLPRFMASDETKHRQDILVSEEEKQLKIKFDACQDTLAKLATLKLSREVLRQLKAMLAVVTDLRGEKRKLEGGYRTSVLCGMAYVGGVVDVKGITKRVREQVKEVQGISTLYNSLLEMSKGQVLYSATSKSVQVSDELRRRRLYWTSTCASNIITSSQLSSLSRQLRTAVVDMFETATSILRLNGAKTQDEVMTMLGFIQLQVEGNEFVAPLFLKGPLSPVEVAVMACKSSIADNKLKAAIAASARSSVGVWAGVSLKELNEWDPVESSKLEGLAMKGSGYDDDAVGRFMSHYTWWSDKRFDDKALADVDAVALIVKFMKR